MNCPKDIVPSLDTEHFFPTPSLNRAGKDAKQHSDLAGSSKQVPSSLARRLPDGSLSRDTESSFAKIESYELWIEGSLVAVSETLEDFQEFIPSATPLTQREVGEFYQFWSLNGEQIEIKLTKKEKHYERNNKNK